MLVCFIVRLRPVLPSSCLPSPSVLLSSILSSFCPSVLWSFCPPVLPAHRPDWSSTALLHPPAEKKKPLH